MSELKKQLGVFQGAGMLTTSLLGTGMFAVPALIAVSAGMTSLWAWPVLMLITLPIALVFAALGRYFPNASGAAHFVTLAFGPRLGKMTSWLFLSVIPLGLPAVMHIASGFWQAAFTLQHSDLLIIQLVTLALLWLVGLSNLSGSAYIQSLIAVFIVLMLVAFWWGGDVKLAALPFFSASSFNVQHLFGTLSVMFWCFVGLEAFAHLAEEFHNPRRDFHKALLLGLLLAGIIYWGCTVVVIYFNHYASNVEASAVLPMIAGRLFGSDSIWVICIIGYLSCFASTNVYTQSFARLIWSQSWNKDPDAWLSRLSAGKAPINALSVVVLAGVVTTLVSWFFTLSLTSLLIYSNGILVLVYLLSMLSGWRLLKGGHRWLALLGALLCAALLLMMGWKSLYALLIFSALWLSSYKWYKPLKNSA
ncbi:MAG: L-methionine/branched-chain amino acid transporter [Enterobacteriaceae bacterium]